MYMLNIVDAYVHAWSTIQDFFSNKTSVAQYLILVRILAFHFSFLFFSKKKEKSKLVNDTVISKNYASG